MMPFVAAGTLCAAVAFAGTLKAPLPSFPLTTPAGPSCVLAQQIELRKRWWGFVLPRTNPGASYLRIGGI